MGPACLKVLAHAHADVFGQRQRLVVPHPAHQQAAGDGQVEGVEGRLVRHDAHVRVYCVPLQVNLRTLWHTVRINIWVLARKFFEILRRKTDLFGLFWIASIYKNSGKRIWQVQKLSNQC